MLLSDRDACIPYGWGRFTQAATKPSRQFLFQVIGDPPKKVSCYISDRLIVLPWSVYEIQSRSCVTC